MFTAPGRLLQAPAAPSSCSSAWSRCNRTRQALPVHKVPLVAGLASHQPSCPCQHDLHSLEVHRSADCRPCCPLTARCAGALQELRQQADEESRARHALQAAHAAQGQDLATAKAKAGLAASERDSLAALLRSYEATADQPGTPSTAPSPPQRDAPRLSGVQPIRS